MPDNSTSRDRILAAARAEFAEHGFAGARVARIARRAGLNKQLIFYYFGSKAGLHAAVAAWIAPASEASPPETAPPERLRRAIAALLARLEARPEFVALLTDRQRGPDATEAARRACVAALSDLARVISDGQGLGYYRDDVDPAVLARHALVLSVGYLALDPLLARAEPALPEWRGAVADLLLNAAKW